MPISKIEDHVVKARFESDVPMEVLPGSNPSSEEFRADDVVRIAKKIHVVAPLLTIKWERTADPSGNIFDLKIDAQAGREWKQTIDVGQAVGEDSGIKWDVRDDYWFLSEFKFIDNLAASLVFLSKQYGMSLTQIDFEV